MKSKELRKLVRKIWENAENKGFHDKPRNLYKKRQLIVDEVSELHDAYRNGKLWEQCDKPISNFSCFAEETSDIIIRACDNIGEFFKENPEKADDYYKWFNEINVCIYEADNEISEVCDSIVSRLHHISQSSFEKCLGSIILYLKQVSIYHREVLLENIRKKHLYNVKRPKLHGKMF